MGYRSIAARVGSGIFFFRNKKSSLDCGDFKLQEAEILFILECDFEEGETPKKDSPENLVSCD